jgi:glycerol-3-phosphate dehydrogenase
MSEILDLVVIGGGINGTGIACDAAGRGLRVLLCEQNDLASATSSNSSKLIHGGLRYLEHYEFRLVRESLAEREVLLKKAPHIIKPLMFQLPHQRHLRPSWMIRAGLFLYDNLAKRVTLPASKSIKFDNTSPLKSFITKGFEYADGWVDDSRLVIFNALCAKENGADIRTQTQCVNAERCDDHWKITLKDKLTDKESIVRSKAVMNAAGPWVAKTFEQVLHKTPPKHVRLVKGSHIVVPRIHEQDNAFILQNEDQRIVFVIPFQEKFSLIGTTDVEFKQAPGEVAISQEEIDYLLEITNSYFKKQISQSDIVSTFSGVRPLLDDESSSAQAVTRDYTLELSTVNKKAPLLSAYGGKITTYRKLAEAAVDKLSPFFPNIKPAWTKNSPLPGGDFTTTAALTAELSAKYPWLTASLLKRFVQSYGTLTTKVLANAHSMDDLGEHFAADLYEKEVAYLVAHEWAHTTQDILWRRTKLGLLFSDKDVQKLDDFLRKQDQSKVA